MWAPMPARFLTHEGRVLPGVKQAIAIPEPPAGSEWSLTVPGGEQWMPLSLHYVLTTSAAVGNRYPGVAVYCAGLEVYRAICVTAIAAGDVIDYTAVAGSGIVNGGTTAGIGMVQFPFVYLNAGDSLSSLTPGLQAGDQYSAVNALVERVFVTDSDITERADEFERAAVAAESQLTQRQPTTTRAGT